ncbi:hypothetical protein J6590_013956 [Homalodisca vitripennis]|nr:hypothetical protein J6590_013956 [Homalodisca vitripennis]
MAGPMRDNSLDCSHRTKVADPRAATAAKAETNFEYDDNEWDIGIGDLIIDLDADIEKTNERTSGGGPMASAASGPPTKGKLAVEHSATVDKGLKMKIKRTKPGTKTSEAKHEIVKSGEQQNGSTNSGEKHAGNSASASASASAGVKRNSSGHRRDKARDKHEVNGVVRPGGVQRVVFPVTVSGPGPPNPPVSEPPPVPSPAPATPPAIQPPPAIEEPKPVPVSPTAAAPTSPPPPPKKVKTSCPSDISKTAMFWKDTKMLFLVPFLSIHFCPDHMHPLHASNSNADHENPQTKR